MDAPKCHICGRNHWGWEAHGADSAPEESVPAPTPMPRRKSPVQAKPQRRIKSAPVTRDARATAPAAEPAAFESPAERAKRLHTARTLSHRARNRDDYNAYQREYMRRRRQQKRQESES